MHKSPHGSVVGERIVIKMVSKTGKGSKTEGEDTVTRKNTEDLCSVSGIFKRDRWYLAMYCP